MPSSLGCDFPGQFCCGMPELNTVSQLRHPWGWKLPVMPVNSLQYPYCHVPIYCF